MTKSRGCSAGMRVAYEQHQEIPIASVDHRERKEEIEMAGNVFRRGFHNHPTEVVLKHMKGG
jgi:hypothetical protein